MRTVLCLGGTGQFGLPIARHLAADPVVDRVIVAGRDLAKAQAAAAPLGPKGDARQVDAAADASLAAAMAGVAVVVSTLWSAEGRAARVALPDALFAPERYLDVTAAAVAVTDRYLLDGTVDARGAATMAVAVRDAERFGRDYLALFGPELAGLDRCARQVVPA